MKNEKEVFENEKNTGQICPPISPGRVKLVKTISRINQKGPNGLPVGGAPALEMDWDLKSF